MKKTFNYNEAQNMVLAVASGYIERDEIRKYFKENFSEDKIFDGVELKQIVHDLTSDRTKNTEKLRYSFNPNVWKKPENKKTENEFDQEK